MAGDTKSFESQSSHLEEIIPETDEFGTSRLSHEVTKTTLYQVVFSLFVGISGWMYNFDLVSSHLRIIRTCSAKKVEGLQRCGTPDGTVQPILWQLRANARWQGRHCR